jgi:hypothetical protein
LLHSRHGREPQHCGIHAILCRADWNNYVQQAGGDDASGQWRAAFIVTY